MGNQGIEDERQCGSWWTGWTNIRMQINWEEQLGSEKDHSVGKESLKLQQREKLPASQESSLERPTGS